MTANLTIFLVGPPKTGKTSIANYIADLSESLDSSIYHPTQGVRILEFERKITADSNKKNQKWKEAVVDVELWDCSGDEQFMHAWPCLANEVHGAIFVVNADSKDEKELDSWQALLANLKPSQCGIFAHRVVPLPQKPKFKTTNKVLSKSVLAYTCLDQDNKTQFDAILAQIYTNYLEKKELEEKNIIA